jgi:mannose-1-phosphate guanylyltransferase
MRHAVILAGGSGERFWPVSRDDRPKPFLDFFGSTSLLRATFLRMRPLIPPQRIWVVTSDRLVRRVRQELPEIPSRNVLGEPRGRNTAPAIALAAARIVRDDPEAVLLVLPADAWVPRPAPFRRAARSVLGLAEREDRLYLVGVTPTRAETGYGYIEPGARLDRGPARAVRRFVEKPSPARARRFLQSGRYLWNAGIFAWPARVFQEEVERYMPALHAAVRPLDRGAWTKSRLETVYAKAPGISVDVGILERSRRVAVVRGEFAWDDLGTWAAVARLDAGFQKGRVLTWDSPGTIVWAEDGPVAVIGVPGVVVVRTREGTLIASLDRAQDVRRVPAALRHERKRATLKEG